MRPLLAGVLLLLGLAACDDECSDGRCAPDFGRVDGGRRDMAPDMPPVDAGPCGPCDDGLLCNEGSGDCVQCLTEAECSGLTRHCSDGGDCVACLGDADCTDPSMAECSPTNTCVGCTSHDACAGRAGASVCDEPSARCVECTVDTEGTSCPAPDNLACHPTDLTCTGAERGSLSTCVQCVSDSECASSAGSGTLRCVPMEFDGASHGSYCLLDLESFRTATADPTAVCPNRWPAARLAMSVAGIEATYCFVDQSLTTCEAVLDFRNACGADDAACGADGQDDGLCRDGLCTYECSAGRDCASGDSADCVGVGTTYCDPN